MSARLSDPKVGIRELSFPFMQEPTEKQPLYISQKYSLSEFYLKMLSLANVKDRHLRLGKKCLWLAGGLLSVLP